MIKKNKFQIGKNLEVEKFIYRVTEEKKDGEITTVGKFQSKDKAQYYINVRQQKDPRHNQW